MNSILHYLNTFIGGYTGYFNYLWQEITFQTTPWYQNYFYGLLVICVCFFTLEWLTPWRKEQPTFRRDFWLEIGYVFFNFFIFSLIGYNAVSNLFVELFNDGLKSAFGISNLVAINIQSLPVWAQLLTLFVVRDFLHWNTHRLLHRVDWLWQFHKVHHSAKQMSWATLMRYHWAETVFYNFLQYLPLAMIGFGINDFFVVYIFTLVIGHLNHSNIYINIGFLKYIFNTPQLHIWHHAKHSPNRFGQNFALTLSLWDYLFGTIYAPHDGRDIELGFEGDEAFPTNFLAQIQLPTPLFERKKEIGTILLLGLATTVAQAQVVTAFVTINKMAVKNATVLRVPADRTSEQEWVGLTDSTGKRRIIAKPNDKLVAYLSLNRAIEHTVRSGQTVDTFAFNTLSCDLSEAMPHDPSKLFLALVKKQEIEPLQNRQLLRFLGQYFYAKKTEILTNEQQWLGYWFRLTNDLDEGGFLYHIQNMPSESEQRKALEALLTTSPSVRGGGFRQILLYTHILYQKYSDEIEAYNKLHHNFWSADFKQKLAELAAAEADIQAALPELEAALLDNIAQHPERFYRLP